MGKLQLLLVLFVFLLFQSVAEASRCGFKPFPKMGCEIGRCMDDGEWEQVCDQYGSESITCGFKPFPKMGCRIGRCMDDGEWEQVCY